MKQYNILGGVDDLDNNHPQFESKKINKNYYGSDLNRFVAERCRKDMVVNNIDLIINDYKNNSIRIVESKHSNEKLSKGQELLLQRLSNLGINTYVVYGDEPYNTAYIYSFQTKETIKVDQENLKLFLDNQSFKKINYI